MARPEEITPDAAEMFLEQISQGLSVKDAAEYAGFDHSSFLKYFKRHPQFFTRVSRARTAKIKSHISALDTLGQSKDPKVASARVKASQCLLAAMDERFRTSKQHIEHSGGISFTDPSKTLQNAPDEDSASDT